MHHAEDARWRPRLGEQLGQPHGGQGILLGRFQHEAVAAGHRQGEHPERYHGGEVERRDADTDPQRLHPGVAIHPARHVAHGLPHGLAGDAAGLLHHLDAAPHISPGVRQILARLLGQQGRQLVVMGFEQMLVVEHDPGPLGGRHLPPQQVGVVSAAHRKLHLGRGGSRHPRQQALIRRVGHLDPGLARRRIRFAADIERQIPVLGVVLAHAALSLAVRWLALCQSPSGRPADRMHSLIILLTPCVCPLGAMPLAVGTQRIYLRLTINLRLR
ncbi:hypothetical protein D3C72_1483790 [compost metagenome]